MKGGGGQEGLLGGESGSEREEGRKGGEMLRGRQQGRERKSNKRKRV